MKLIKKADSTICCLIPKDDFPKAILLTNIAKEEGAAFVEIRVPIEQTNFENFNLAELKVYTILSIEPLEYLQKSNKVISDQLKVMINLQPNYIELNSSLEGNTIQELSKYTNEKQVGVIISKYFDEFPKKKTLLQQFKELQIAKSDIIKIIAPAENEFDANEMLQLYKSKKDYKLVALCSKESGKFSQLLAPILGAEFTYGYISRKSDEAQIPLNILKQNLEVLYRTLM